LGVWVVGTLAGIACAETFQLNDGQTLSGEVVSYDKSGLIVKLGEGKYSDRVPWGKFSQADLKELAKNPKIKPLMNAFIEVPQEEKLKKTEVTLKPVPRLDRPQPGSLLGALFTSSVGLAALLLLYAANLYAAYEVALFRTRPVVLPCLAAAILPVIGPIIFLALPAQMVGTLEKDEIEAPGEESPSPIAMDSLASIEPVDSGLHLEQPEEAPAETALPETQVFQRGQFTFNRRFFETKFSGFFSVVRRDAEKDMVLVINSARGEFVAQRISRIAANDLHVEVQKGVATKEVMVPFTEIQEVQLKHKDT
jgi:hypothetical protein